MSTSPYLRSIAVWSIKHLRPLLDTDPPPDSTCGICHDPYDNNEHIAVRITGVPDCAGHVFGATCLMEWFTSGNAATCPMCRARLFAGIHGLREIVGIDGQDIDDAEIAGAYFYSDEYDVRIDTMRRLLLSIERDATTFENIALAILESPRPQEEAMTRIARMFGEHGIQLEAFVDVLEEIRELFGVERSGVAFVERLQSWAAGSIVIPVLGPQGRHAEQAPAMRRFVMGINLPANDSVELDSPAQDLSGSPSPPQNDAAQSNPPGHQAPRRSNLAFSAEFNIRHGGMTLGQRNVMRVAVMNISLLGIAREIYNHVERTVSSAASRVESEHNASPEVTDDSPTVAATTEPSLADAMRGVRDAVHVLCARIGQRFLSRGRYN